MPPKDSEQNPLSEEMNIRKPEERYGGEGHTDDQEFARERHDGSRAAPDMPEVDSDDLIERPQSAEERARDDSGSPAIKGSEND